jgi:ATP-dependent Zn protease
MRQTLTKRKCGLRITAFHEAGHCVAAVILGLHLASIAASVIPDGDDLGNTFVWPPQSKDKEEALKFATYLLSGTIAERVLAGEEKKAVPAAHGDIKMAEETLKVFGDSEENLRARRQSVESAKQIVRDNWPAVEAVASVLIQLGSLSSKHVKSLVRKSKRSACIRHSKAKTSPMCIPD